MTPSATLPGAGDAGEPPSSGHVRTDLPSERLHAIAHPADGKRRGTFAAYLHLVQERRWFYPAVWTLLMLRHSPVIVFPYLTKLIFDLLNDAPHDVGAALRWILPLTFGLCLLNVVATVGQRFLLSRQKRSLTAGLRRALMRRLHRLAFVFHDRTQTGVLQNKFILDLNRLEELQNYLSEALMMQGTTVLICLAIVGWHSPWFLLVIACAVPLNLIVAKLLWKQIRRHSEEYRRAETGFLAMLHEALAGVRLTRAHATESFTEERVGDEAGRVAEKGLRFDVTNAFFGSSAWATSSLLQMVVVGMGALMCARGAISWGDLYLFFTYYIIVSGSMGQIVNGMPAVASAADAIASLSELYTAEDEEHSQGRVALPALTGHVALRGVTFAYPGSERHSLGGLDLDIPAGTSLALVGASGSGKSTIASLVLGFYQPQQGSVEIDGRDLRGLDRRSLRRQVGVVSQDVVLFHDSVTGNIAWGDPRPDPARVRLAAERANALDFIERLPHAFATQLGERGLSLSGGQRQRLAIARALYRDPRLLILDEATSALDPESERVVQRALDHLMQGRTTLIIAHRLSTVRRADRIAVLDQGKVIESGTYDELLAKRGAFFQLAEGQMAE